jgi:hypothetical protein
MLISLSLKAAEAKGSTAKSMKEKNKLLFFDLPF